MIAMGHENYYHMGVNLAASLKRNSALIDISIVTDKYYPENAHIFDNVIVRPDLEPITAKTLLYELSPYTRTIYLDVDMIILPGKDINVVFNELDGIPFQIMNTCKGDEYSVWTDAQTIRAATNNHDDPLPTYYSELIYFEKGESMKEYFDKVKWLYVNSKIRGRSFAGVMADELAFILASMEMKVFPKKFNWLPVFWFFRDKKDTALQSFTLGEKYYGYSLGGNNYPEYVKAQYNNLVAYYSQVMKVTKPYKAKDKRLYLSNRSKI